MKIVKGTVCGKEEEKEKERISMIRFCVLAVKCRMPGGELFKILSADISRNAPCRRILFDVLNLIVGGKVSYRLFPKMNIEITGEYTADGYLYHITPAENIKAIKQKGIVSKRNHVFLTDDIDYMINAKDFPDWKATALGENTNLCVLKICVSSLKKRRKVFCIDREHEYVTKKVEPECVLFE